MFGPDDALSSRLSTLLLVSAVCVLLAGLVLGSVAAGAVGPGILDRGSDSTEGLTQEDPAGLQSERDLSAFERQLAQRIQGQVESGAINLSQGQYGDVRERLDSSEYEELLDSYRSVSEETGNTERARNVTAFRRALANYTGLAERYSQTYSTYRLVQSSRDLRFGETWAGSTGHDDVTRSVARRLERIESALETNASRVAAVARTFDGDVQLDFDRTVESVQASFSNISARQAEVRADAFVQTELALDVRSTNASFREPLTVSGRLRLANGTAVTNRSIRFEVGEQTITTRTDAAGAFSFAYRPVTLPVDTEELSIRYVPDEMEPYLGANATVDISVASVEPTVDVSVASEPTVEVSPAPARVGYSDTVGVFGRVSVDDVGVPDAPVLVFADGRLLANATTGSDGTFERNVSIPATLEPGNRSLQARLALQGRSIQSADGSTTISVRERSTELSLTTTALDDRTARVTGRLTAADGRAIPNQTVTITADGEQVATVSTNASGWIDTTVLVPSGAVSDGRAELVASFDGRGLNLGSSDARATVSVSASGLPLWLLGGGLLVVAVAGVGIGGFVWRRSRSESSEPEASPDVIEDDAVADDSTDSGLDPEALLAAARESAPQVAVRLAYAAVRVSLDGPRDGTHWEFYRACTADADDAELASTLRTVTEGYERTNFAGDSVSESEAERIVSAADSLVR
ncbi:hypothetical protein [Halapricum salinum]|uniref:DUF4129 domain-containing protein n=1 Tax=Halapricum salinum TaxID=1457250 RepID=A0A4D6HF90_9EURY|nr:hypothetical protein [Halapricum salinum]QCC51722.1 hypothetical protein DV733_10960 [Halapricum salinum]